MLYTVLKENSYQDSINLMLLTNHISVMEDVNKVQIMMGTDANKEIFKGAGLLSKEAENANPSDMVIVVDTDKKSIVDKVLETVEKFLSDLSIKKEDTSKTIRNWDELEKTMPDANLALISIPGEYGAIEIENAIDRGMHAFVFSDNISKEDEVRLKKKAHEKGLLVMGPDCGTGIINNVPLAFTNVIHSGNIGIVGASGTGIQEVSTIIDKLGEGITNAIGTGGNDLSTEVGAITTKDAIVALANHEFTDVIVVISKPPAKEVRDDVVKLLHSINKSVVAIFLGEKPKYHEGNIYFAHTLEETAMIAVDLAKGNKVSKNYYEKSEIEKDENLNNKTIKGLYSGGTLAYEASMLIKEALNLKDIKKEHGYILKTDGFEIIDLGDDIYTQGKPHPMIDPSTRIEKLKELAKDENTGIILLDIVLGYGSHLDMASELAPVIKEITKNSGKYIIGTICGTKEDPQDYLKTIKTLEDAGMIVEKSNLKAVRKALNLKGIDIIEEDKEIIEYKGDKVEIGQESKAIKELLTLKPKIINMGIAGFAESIKKFGGTCVQFDWKPIAGGNKKLIKILNQLKQLDNIEEENMKVVEEMKKATPFLIDVVTASSVIKELNGKVLLHAGPPIKYSEMTGPMQGSCIGAALFEGWAKDEKEARELLENEEVKFIPCHHVKAVGPMGGITSGNMPVLVIENKYKGNRSYCTLNEGIGKVLRFGAYSPKVVERLIWMKDILGPVLGKAIKKIEGGINLNVIIAKAITMGDEFHQRNIAASLLFLKEVTPLIIGLDIDEKLKKDVIQFLADTDQFFLNIMMATGKSIVDGARLNKIGTVVTTMTRNGKEFGIRISGLGDEWFTAPVNTPKGLFFTGFTQDDANPDIGDSSITETVGVGGMSMIAAPGVTRFVGAGGFKDALRVSEEMSQITVIHNSNFTIPNWDFKGAPLGIDIRKVIETGITPIINTGIAHKKAGLGQVGAGTVHAPLACFEKALIAYAKYRGIKFE
ncbi:bifunctional FdrA/YlbE family protein [Oceanivirga salmonicida]|uniref:DUF1116 domain-containing protein n=1 Tax=Oceanivirga salmonicida TaxID=1769291 RepID=UPI0009EC7B57|nr:DUF1116 domain-containing protein [Oceanivirga salmonicida]